MQVFARICHCYICDLFPEDPLLDWPAYSAEDDYCEYHKPNSDGMSLGLLEKMRLLIPSGSEHSTEFDTYFTTRSYEIDTIPLTVQFEKQFQTLLDEAIEADEDFKMEADAKARAEAEEATRPKTFALPIRTMPAQPPKNKQLHFAIRETKPTWLVIEGAGSAEGQETVKAVASRGAVAGAWEKNGIDEIEEGVKAVHIRGYKKLARPTPKPVEQPSPFADLKPVYLQKDGRMWG